VLTVYIYSLTRRSRQDRLRTHLAGKAISDCKHGTVVRLEDIVHSENQSNDDHVVLTIHDILASYYKVALKRFIDNVRMQVADDLLVTGPDTPLKIFSANFVLRMSMDTLEDVAGEDPSIKRRREELVREIKGLEDGKKVIG
jgi:hypothetical protein